MIELPEAIVVAAQITDHLKTKTIRSAKRRYTPHKFVFTGEFTDEEFAQAVAGKTIGNAWANGNVILIQLEPKFLLSLGVGGERIHYHPDATTLPKKHQLLLEFEDASYLTVTISGWGEVRLLREDNLRNHPHIGFEKPDPLSSEFTEDTFNFMIEKLPTTKKFSAKKFFISEPGLRGIGNGVIQEIFYRAGIHPQREMRLLSLTERESLFDSTKDELQKMVDMGGRDSEKDLFGIPGRYPRKMSSKTVNTPCSNCGEKIEKKQYLGGNVYFCPSCQPY